MDKAAAVGRAGKAEAADKAGKAEAAGRVCRAEAVDKAGMVGRTGTYEDVLGWKAYFEMDSYHSWIKSPFLCIV